MYSVKEINANFNGTVKEKTKKLSNIEMLFLIMVMAYYLLPVISVRIPLVIALAIALIYVAYLYVQYQKASRYYLLVVGSALIISIFYLFLTNTATITQDVSNYELKRLFSKFNQVFMAFFPVMLFLRMQTKATTKQKRIICWTAIVLFAYVLINTLLELLVNADATRNWSDFSEQSENNVGTYAFVYVVPIILSCIPYLFVRFKRPLFRFLIVASAMLLFLFLFLAQYTLALLIGIIGLFIQINIVIKDKKLKTVLWLCLLLIVFSLPVTLELLANVVPSGQMAIRLKELASFFGNGDSSGYNLNGRLSLYMQSIKAFFNSPILGNRKLDFDGHATFLTVPADIGIFGAFFFFALYHLAKKQIKQHCENYKYFLPAFICLVLMGLTNPIHSAFPLMFAVWFIIPLIIICAKKEDENEISVGN